MITFLAKTLFKVLVFAFLWAIFKNTTPDFISSDGVDITMHIFLGVVAGLSELSSPGNPK